MCEYDFVDFMFIVSIISCEILGINEYYNCIYNIYMSVYFCMFC